jgi:hypothetical protein
MVMLVGAKKLAIPNPKKRLTKRNGPFIVPAGDKLLEDQNSLQKNVEGEHVNEEELCIFCLLTNPRKVC